MQKASQDLTKGGLQYLLKFYAVKISLFRVSTLSDKKGLLLRILRNKNVHFQNFFLKRLKKLGIIWVAGLTFFSGEIEIFLGGVEIFSGGVAIFLGGVEIFREGLRFF